MPSTPSLVAIGYHGTHSDHVDSIYEDGWHISGNEWDWLGDGVYFFQDSPSRAREWAEKRHGKAHAAVLRATIALEDCVDLLDIGWWDPVRRAHREFVAREKALPVQLAGSLAHRLDRAVLNYMVTTLAEAGQTVRTLRAAFVEGDRLHETSALFSHSHVQIAVRDLALIRSLEVVG